MTGLTHPRGLDNRGMRIVLGITGGIAAYKTPGLVRLLRAAGHEVRPVLTANGARLVSVLALATVAGQPVAEDMWAADARREIEHIELARWAEILLVAPATANFMGRCAHGLADDLLSTLYLACDPAVAVHMAPAMNTRMWEHPAVRRNREVLLADGVRFIGPADGELACGECGPGAMVGPEDIVEALAG